MNTTTKIALIAAAFIIPLTFVATDAQARTPQCGTCGGGHYRLVRSRVLVRAGHWTNQYTPPLYRTVSDHCGTVRRVLVRAGGYRRVYVPPVYRWTTRRVHVPCTCSSRRPRRPRRRHGGTRPIRRGGIGFGFTISFGR